MLETGKISALQMGLTIYPVLMSTAMLAGPNVMAKEAMNDLWISPIWASLIGFACVIIAHQLHEKYPQKTIIEQIEEILGKLFGKVVGFFYLFFFLQLSAFIVREYADFIAIFLKDTPLSVISGVLVLVSAMAVTGGVEVVVRSAQFFFPLFVIPLLIMIGLIFPDLEPQNIFPILGNGLLPSLKGAMTPQGWFSEVFLISFFLPFLADEKKGKRSGMVTVGFVMISMCIVNLVTYFLMGDATGRILFPVMDTARYISVADFFENLESGVMAIWVIGAYVKVSVFYYVTVLGTAQWLKLTTYRPIVLPIGLLTVVFSFWGLPNFAVIGDLHLFTIPVVLFLFCCFFPAILLVISVWKKNNTAYKGVRSG
ncbi:germination protein [Brevibacillus reuszeri]|uniref:Germination protein n=1 Tax=Brevibacillus reuszeri TaxID=54915 RepID=A0A0K9YNX8_9BACL|nr:endospore germination permease [Brevibacillus reuszeri]KNB70376.1 spore gernimation protein [Brevibacillus reuszeri]MED1857904.1 endospore germination permease [Brevibacillus reuszeri]GED71770.1 germination protein [Brevibacillus reuszeri]